jgi:hypothetical protein
MNYLIRLPEQGKELRTTLPADYTQEHLSLSISSSLGLPAEAFILLTSEGYSLKDRAFNASNSDIIYAFLKDSIKQERVEIEVRFTQSNSIPLNPLPGDDKGVLTMEKNLHRMYKQALELSDFFMSYAAFAEQINTEMEIVNSAKQVLKMYHKKHIQDQADNFASLQQKSLNHYLNAKKEFDVFDLAVQKLSSTKIHDQLSNPSRISLSDLIDVTQLSKWKESYMDEINRLQLKFEEIKSTIDSMPSTFKLPEEDSISVEVVLVPDMITQGYTSVIDLYLDYRKLCEQFLTSRDAKAGQRLHEEPWEQKANKATQNLSILAKTLPQYQNLVGGLQDYRKLGNFQLFKLLRKITEFAARIRDSVKSQLSMLSSLLKRSEKRLAFIKVPRLLPEAHDSAIFEISRRNLFVQVAGKIKDRLNLLIETETAERMAFLEKYRHVLPNNFVPQLSAGPFLKVVVGNNEPDLNLPKLFLGLPSDFLHGSLYEQGFSNEESNLKALVEIKENLEVQVRSLTQSLEEVRRSLDAKNDEIKAKDAQIEQQTQALMKEVNKCKFITQTSEFEKAELRKGYQELENKLQMIRTAVCAEHSDHIKELKAVYNESTSCLKAMESKFKASQLTEAQLKAENDKLREELLKIAGEVRTKDKRLLEAAETLKAIQVEFKNKEDLIKELKEKLSQVPKTQEIRVKDPGLESLCKDLGISNESLPEYVKKLRQSDSSKISFTSFNEGSLALFFPTAEGQFLAFNYNCPDHFLNTDLLSPQAIEAMHNEPYIVGLITEKKRLLAERNNPLSLPQGSEYFLLTIKTDF